MQETGSLITWGLRGLMEVTDFKTHLTVRCLSSVGVEA